MIFGKGEFYDTVVFVGAKQDSDGGILGRQFFYTVIVIGIHLQLSDVLMCEFISLDFDDYKALQETVVEHQIYEVTVSFEGKSALSSFK